MARKICYENCYRLRYKISNNYCSNKIKAFNAAKLEKIENSKSEEENAQSLFKIMIKNVRKKISMRKWMPKNK